MVTTCGNQDWWHQLSRHCSRVQITDWIILLRNQFDLHWKEEPHVTRMILFHPESCRFITRVLGRTLGSGTLESVNDLPSLALKFFMSNVCLGSKEDQEGVFPFSLLFSPQCSMTISEKHDSNGDIDQETKDWNHSQCEKCRNLSIDENEPIFDNIGMYLDGTESDCKQEIFKEDIEDYGDDIPELFLGNDRDDGSAQHIPRKRKRKAQKSINNLKSELEVETMVEKKSSKEPEGSIKCPVCPKEYRTNHALRRHMRDYHLRGQFKCLYCESSNVVFKFPHEILDHYKAIHSSNVKDCRVHCPACQNILDLSEDPNTLASHYRECVWAKKRQRFKVVVEKQREMRKNTEFVCSDCGKRYKSGQQLQFHMKTHTGEGMMFCPHCPYKTPNPGSLKLHVAKHLRDQGILPKEMCELCGVEVRDKSSLKSHMNTHETQRWNCNHCDRRFKSQRYLDCHVARFHDKSETFKCDVCAKGFSTKFLLKDHKRRNHLERTFKCAHCGKMMYSKTSLIAHERIHTGETPYRCQLCDYTCKSSSTLSLHRKFIHNQGKNLTDHPLQIPNQLE